MNVEHALRKDNFYKISIYDFFPFHTYDSSYSVKYNDLNL